MIDFIFDVQGDALVIKSAGALHISGRVLSEAGKKIKSSTPCESMGIYTSAFSLKIDIKDIEEFLVKIDIEIKSLLLKDFAENGSYFKIDDILPFLRKESYESLINALKKANHPLADKIAIPKEARFHDLIDDKMFSYLQIEDRYGPDGKIYSRLYPEVEFLIDCLLHLKQDKEGNLYCNPNDCLSYLKYFKEHADRNAFSEKMTYLLNALDPDLTLSSTDDLHEKFCFTSVASSKLMNLLETCHCLDVLVSEKKALGAIDKYTHDIIKSIETILTHSLFLKTRLETVSRTNAAYTDARDKASIFHESLLAASQKCKEDLVHANKDANIKISISKFIFSARLACENVTIELSKHRSIWYNLYPLVRQILGILGTITIIPGLVVAAVSPHGYMDTFFRLPSTKSMTLINKLDDEIDAVNRITLNFE